MQKKLLIVIAILLAIPSIARAGIYGTIEGRVLDIKGKPLGGATVKVLGTKRGANAKADGSFKINQIEAKTYTVEASFVGYQSSKYQVTVSADKTSEITIKLREKKDTLAKEVVVLADKYKELVSKDREGTVRERTGDDNTKIAVENVQQAVALSSGVILDGGGFVVRGSRPENTQILVDGQNMSDQFTGGMGANGTRTAPTVSAFGVEQVQVIAGGFSAEYGNALGGVVNTVIKTGNTDRYEGLFRWRTDVPSLWGQANNGLDFMGRNENNFDVNFGGPLPGLEGSTFFISGKNSYAQFDNNGIGVIDPWGNNLGQIPNDQAWINNLTGRVKLAFGKFSLTFGGQLGITAREAQGWGWLYATRPQVLNLREVNGRVIGDTNFSIQERLAKNAVINAYQNNLMARVNQIIDENSSFEVTVSYNQNNSEVAKRSSFEDPGFFSGIEVYEPLDRMTFENGSFDASKANRSIDVYEGAEGVRNPKTGFFEGQTDRTSSRNPYGRAQFFDYTGNERALDFRFASYIKVDGNYSLDIKAGELTHNLKTGFEFNTFEIERFNNNLPWDENGFFDVYTSRFDGNVYADENKANNYYKLTSRPYNPWDAAFFIQDQINFKGIVFSPGIRFDAFSANVRHRVDFSKFQPIENIETAAFADTKPKFMISPRISVAYPITDRSIVNLSYGIYYQKPLFTYLYDGFSANLARGNVQIGNPDLEPQRTNQFQVAYNLQLSDDFAFDLTAYYKDDYNMVGLAYVADSENPYYFFSGGEYGSSRGLELTLRKRPTDHFGFDINYTLASVTSTSTNASDNSNLALDVYTLERAIPLADFPTSFDRRHTVNAIVNLVWAKNEGPSIAGIYPLENVDIGFTGRYRSGLPFTPLNASGNAIGDNNSARLPDRFDLDMRFSKAFMLADWFGEDLMKQTRIEFFVDVINLANFVNAVSVFARTNDPLQDSETLNLTAGSLNGDVWYKEANEFISESSAASQFDANYKDRLYNATIDTNNDGKNTIDEKYQGYLQYVSDFQNRRTNFQAPRQVYLGFMIRF